MIFILIVIGGICILANSKYKERQAAKREEEQRYQEELRKQEAQAQKMEKESNTEKESQRDPLLTKEEKEMRGVWVSSVINLDYPVSPTFSSSELSD